MTSTSERSDLQPRFDPDRLDAFLRLLPRTTGAAAELAAQHDDRLGDDRVALEVERPWQRIRHALEVRHESFRSAEFCELARRHRVAIVVSDSPSSWPTWEEVTSDLVYVRLHGDTELYASGYTEEALDRWAEKIRRWAEQVSSVVVYLDNDALGHAPFDAERLAARLR